MNLNQMYYYIAVCECESFSKAADDIYVSQPTLSKQIAALEAELGVKLIDRSKRGDFALTRIGEEYYKSFRRIVSDFEETTLRAKFEAAQSLKPYRVGLMEGWLLHNMMKKCIAAIKSEFPDVELYFEYLDPLKLCSHMGRRKLDLALITDDAYRPVEGCCREELVSLDGLLYVSASNPYIEGGEIQVLRLKNEILYSLPSKSLPKAKNTRIYNIMGGKNLFVRECPTIDSVRMGVLSGSGYGFGDAWSDVAHNDRFCVKWLPDAPRHISTLRHEDDVSPVTKALMSHIKSWAAAPSFDI